MSGKDAATGHFLPGNRFWEARSSHGRNPKFAGPDQLEAACFEYFEWAHENPLWEDRLVTFQGAATHEPVAKMRAMTLDGLHLYLDIDESTWRDWRTSRPDFSRVIEKVEKAIRQQKFSGAAADLLNANIISRDLGLADRQELTGEDGGPIQMEAVNRDADAFESAIAGIATRGGPAGDAGKPDSGGEG